MTGGVDVRRRKREDCTADEGALVVVGAVPPGLIVHWLPPPTDNSNKKRPKGDDVDDAISTTVAQIVRMLEHGKLRDPSSAQVGSDGMRPVGASDIAVLVRTNKQVAWMRDALAAAGIGAATQGNDSVFDSEAEIGRAHV